MPNPLKNLNNRNHRKTQTLNEEISERNELIKKIHIFWGVVLTLICEIIFLSKMILSNKPISEIWFDLIFGLFLFGYFSFLITVFLVYFFEDFHIFIYEYFFHKLKPYLSFIRLKRKHIFEREFNKSESFHITNPDNQTTPLGLSFNINQDKNLKDVNKISAQENDKLIAQNNDVDEENEKEIIEKLSQISKQCSERFSENTKIFIGLSRKKVWRDIYQKDIDIINENCDFIKNKITYFEQNISLLNPIKQGQFQIKLNIMRSFEKSRESSIISNLKQNSNKSVKSNPQKSEKLKTSKPISKRQAQLFDGENELKESTEIPKTKKRRVFRKGKIKASSAFYLQLSEMKMTIGEIGELLVMEFESKRLIKEEENGSIKRLEHTSKVKGDGFGYDIRSFENQKEVFIEVKTTTGNFSSGLFFTKREVEVMNELNEQYYLYRIFNFDQLNKTGQLYIFRGKQEIESCFEFKPNVYRLELKEGN